MYCQTADSWLPERQCLKGNLSYKGGYIPRLVTQSLCCFLSTHHMAVHMQDLEKDIMSARARPTIPSWNSSAPGNANINDSSQHTPLQLFQVLVGIHTPPDLTQDGVDVVRATDTSSKRARTDNIGLYQRAKERERSARIAYLLTSYTSNILYIFQILLAATFTSLSAYKDAKPVALTVLGALNTVLAG